MGNASQQSKQKQKTLKKDSQVTQDKSSNGAVREVNIYLSSEQADLFKTLLNAMTQAQNNLNFAFIAANIHGESIIGGDLDADKPHLIIQAKNA
jgi:hypothetical protein